MAFGKRNHVSLNPLDANICLLGLPKIGKTTIMKEIAEQLVGEDGYLFLEMYRENGAKYIEDIVYEDVPDWGTFVEIIDDIVDNKVSDYPDLKVVFIDTIDNALQLAEQESLRIWNKENPKKRTKSLNAAWGGFQGGQDYAMELFQEQVFRLRQVGVAFSLIGHVKQTTVTDPITLESYRQISSDLSQRYFNQLKKNIDLVGIAYIDREVVSEKTGRKNIVTGQEETVNKVVSEARKIKFRDPNYCVDSGGRMAYIKEEINFDATEFIQAMKDALEAAVEQSGKSVKDRYKENDKAAKAETKRIAEAEKAKKSQKELNEIISEIVNYFTENKTNLDIIKPVLAKVKELGYKNPTEITDIEHAKTILSMILK
jgi:DNA polymerase III delta prime subunit